MMNYNTQRATFRLLHNAFGIQYRRNLSCVRIMSVLKTTKSPLLRNLQTLQIDGTKKSQYRCVALLTIAQLLDSSGVNAISEALQDLSIDEYKFGIISVFLHTWCSTSIAYGPSEKTKDTQDLE